MMHTLVQELPVQVATGMQGHQLIRRWIRPGQGVRHYILACNADGVAIVACQPVAILHQPCLPLIARHRACTGRRQRARQMSLATAPVQHLPFHRDQLTRKEARLQALAPRHVAGTDFR